jgi:hypothetical protein
MTAQKCGCPSDRHDHKAGKCDKPATREDKRCDDCREAAKGVGPDPTATVRRSASARCRAE